MVSFLTHIKAPMIGENDDGFSLLETLFALVIMSIASLALFQSTSAMLSVSDRAVAASETAIERALSDRALTNLMASLVPHWSEEAGAAFVGNSQSLRGVSTAALGAGTGLHGFGLQLRHDTRSDENKALIYTHLNRSGVSQTPLVLQNSLPTGAQFFYLGLNGRWYRQWPPEQTPVTPYFDDATYIQPSPLPEAVKLEAPNQGIITMVKIDSQPALPSRMDVRFDVP